MSTQQIEIKVMIMYGPEKKTQAIASMMPLKDLRELLRTLDAFHEISKRLAAQIENGAYTEEELANPGGVKIRNIDEPDFEDFLRRMAKDAVVSMFEDIIKSKPFAES